MPEEVTMCSPQRQSQASQRGGIPGVFVVKGWTFSGLDSLPRDVGESLYSELLKRGRACGCQESTIGFLSFGALYVLWSSCQSLLPGEPMETRWWFGFLVAIIGCIVGKCIGLWLANRRFESLRHEVAALNNQRSPIKVAIA
jgi:hypothetical protein